MYDFLIWGEELYSLNSKYVLHALWSKISHLSGESACSTD